MHHSPMHWQTFLGMAARSLPLPQLLLSSLTSTASVEFPMREHLASRYVLILIWRIHTRVRQTEEAARLPLVRIQRQAELS